MDPSLIEYSSPRARSRFIKRKKDTITSITRGWATIDSPHHTRLSEPPIIEAARPLIGEARLLFPRLRGRVKTNEWSRNRSSQGRKEFVFESKTSAFLPYVSFEHFRLERGIDDIIDGGRGYWVTQWPGRNRNPSKGDVQGESAGTTRAPRFLLLLSHSVPARLFTDLVNSRIEADLTLTTGSSLIRRRIGFLIWSSIMRNSEERISLLASQDNEIQFPPSFFLSFSPRGKNKSS